MPEQRIPSKPTSARNIGLFAFWFAVGYADAKFPEAPSKSRRQLRAPRKREYTPRNGREWRAAKQWRELGALAAKRSMRPALTTSSAVKRTRRK